jgi:tetratricopeptide (TPR) repeat protein
MKSLLAALLVAFLSQGTIPVSPAAPYKGVFVAAPADVPQAGMFQRNDLWPEDVLRLYREAVSIDWEANPSDAIEAYRQVLLRLQDFPEALRDSLETRYMAASARTWVASLLTTTNRFSEARSELDEAKRVSDDLLLNWDYSLSLVRLARTVRTRMSELDSAMGDSEEAARSISDALDIVATFAAERPDDEELQSELAMTMQYTANSCRVRGETAEAQKIAGDLIRIRLQLLRSHPTDLNRMRDASSAHLLVGELARETGSLDNAKSAFVAALELRQQIARLEPGLSSSDDLLPVYSDLVNLAREEAQWPDFKVFAELGLTASKSILQQYPGKAGASESVAVFLTMLADWEVQQDNLAGAERYLTEALLLRREAAKNFPLDARSQRSLHVALNRIGDIYRQQKRLLEARRAIEAGKQISIAMVERDPADLSLQRYLSVSYNKIAECDLEEGLPDKALENYREGLRIRRSIASLDQGSVAAKLDVVRSLSMIADAAKSEAEYREAIAILEGLKASGSLPAVYDDWFERFRRNLDDLHQR